MRIGAAGYAEAAGLWEPKAHRIVIKRSELRSLDAYAGTLLHEVAHAVRRDAGRVGRLRGCAHRPDGPGRKREALTR